jgi:Tfp pilus assembly protein PilN
MNRVNLIPPHRRRAKARRTRLRNWIAINIGYALILGLAGVTVCAQSFATKAPAGALMAANRDIDLEKSQLSATRAAIAHAQQIIALSKGVSDQPDWSRLLAPLANSLGDDILLNRCELSAIKNDSPGNPQPKEPQDTSHMSLHLAGLARSQSAVAQFMLRLEAMGLFDHVNLQQTSREQFMDGDAVKFELNCPLRGRMGGTQ